MNTATLEIAATAAPIEKNYLLTKEQYLALKEAWNAVPTHTAEQVIAYNLLRSLPPTRGFTPLTEHKISSHNNDAWNGYNNAMWGLRATLRKASADESLSPQRRLRDTLRQDQSEKDFARHYGIELTEALRVYFLEALQVKK